MPIIPRISKVARVQRKLAIKDKNACLNLLTWLKEIQEKRGIQNEYEFERELDLPPNTLNRLRLFMRPNIPLAFKIAESTGTNFEGYMEIVNRPRKEDDNIRDFPRGWGRWLEWFREIKEDIRLNLLDCVEYLKTQSKKLKQWIFSSQRSGIYNEKGESISLAGAMVQHCIQELNWKDEDIKSRLDYLGSLGNQEWCLSWEGFNEIRNGSRKLADDMEVTAIAILLDPLEMVASFIDWQIIQNYDDANFKPKENPQSNQSEEKKCKED
ncbi:MAG: hypothetical protein J7647_05505 [Cyanobacteria bacterium SBLK]|nr:hypothetical protein [Cyanobacteria bacterium SBLK]